MRTLEYTVMSLYDMIKFENLVNKSLQFGWVLQGGLSVTQTDAGTLYSQALVKIINKVQEG